MILKHSEETKVQSRHQIEMNGQGKNCSQGPNKSPVTDLDYQVLVQYYLQLFGCEAHFM